ncbi:MAG: ABC transporter permease [Bacteroidaceae bacterium]|nr:ABC transporter permease [Bacteroidaceae bacterium]
MERFIASRLYRQDDGVRGGTRPAMLIATIGIALGIFVMILSIAVTRGFRNQIREKVTGFAGDILVVNISSGNGIDEEPVVCPPAAFGRLSSDPALKNVQRYVSKAGILKTDSAFQGIVLKGVGPEYDWSFLESCLVEGRLPECGDSASADELLLSRSLADRMELNLDDKVDVYFMQDRIRMRRLVLTGIYQTNFSDYDNIYGLTGLQLMQRLNDWDESMVSGLEVTVTDPGRMYESFLTVRNVMDQVADSTGVQSLVRTTEQINAGLFAWLDVLNINVWVILLLMLGIAGFTMISGLLIIIFERTRMIGILKALGASNMSVRKIFLHLSARIVGKGMIVGNVVGITFCLLQQWLKIIPLDPGNYYIDSVPCELGLGWLILLNVAMFLLSMLMLVAPSAVVSRIYPSRSIRFE